MTELGRLMRSLRASRGFAHKRDIASVLPRLPVAPDPHHGPNGDDCAVLPDRHGGGHLLLAIEGLVQDFVEARPWFAGYSAVMVNLSDIAAMGGRPTAVVDALWSSSDERAAEVIAGMRSACERYGVPLVGGHTNLRSRSDQLAVAVLGHAERLISSFAAQPGDRLLMAVDLRGHWEAPFPFWNASTEAPPARLQADLALLPALAEAGVCDAGKDISMAGVLGTVLMLLDCSSVGATVVLDQLPRPADVPTWQAGLDEAGTAAWLRWLCAFPSYGYVLSVRPAQAAAVLACFAASGITCADIGQVDAGHALRVQAGEGVVADQALLWDLARSSFITGKVIG